MFIIIFLHLRVELAHPVRSCCVDNSDGALEQVLLALRVHLQDLPL